jgi:hypothetical protein
MGAVRLKSALRGASEASLQRVMSRIVPIVDSSTPKAKERVSKQALVGFYSCINYCAILSGRNGMRSRYHIISCSASLILVIRYYRSWSQVIDSSLVVVD